MTWLSRFRGHLHTVNHHRKLVRQLCFSLGLYKRGFLHDLSKFTPVEFLPGVRYYEGTRSPQVQERRANGYSAAWMHHKGRNRHHFEYWTDYNPKAGRRDMPVDMPAEFFAEMVCDRIAASMTYNRENYNNTMPYQYFMEHKCTYRMHPATSRRLETVLRILAERGQKASFRYLRKNILKK